MIAIQISDGKNHPQQKRKRTGEDGSVEETGIGVSSYRTVKWKNKELTVEEEYKRGCLFHNKYVYSMN